MKSLIRWVGNALSEKGNPSSKRLFGFLFVLTICGCIIYEVCAVQKLEPFIFWGSLAIIALLAGVATMPQLISLWKGNAVPDTKECLNEEKTE